MNIQKRVKKSDAGKRDKKRLITIIKIDSPLKKSGRKTLKIKLPAGQVTLRLDFITQHMPKNYHVIINGRTIKKENYKTTLIRGGQFVTLMQEIKGDDGQETASLLIMVGSLAASILVPGVGPVVAGAVQFLGGAIVSLFDPPETTEAATVDNYSWENPKPVFSQGAPIGITYGEIRNVTPQVLACSQTSDGPNYYLNYLLSGGEGELDSIANITLNGVDLTEQSDYTLETRMGTNDQEGVSIATLGESQSAQPFSYELSTTSNYYTEITNNNQAHSLEFTFRSTAGLYAVKNANTGVADRQGWAAVDTKFSLRHRLSIEYRLHGTTTYTVKNETISGSDQTPIFQKYRYYVLTPGQYDVRVKVIATEILGDHWQYDAYGYNGVHYNTTWYASNSNLMTTYFTTLVKSLSWEAVTTFFNILPIRPCLSLVALKIKATDQISGSVPAVAWTQTRSQVWVWNPATNAYVAKPANNPWWAAYDLIHCCRKIKNLKTGLYEYKVYGAPAATIIFDEFATCAQYTDDTDLYFNYFYNEQLTLAEALKIATTIGRGSVVIKGSKFGATCDMPKEPSGLFTMGNIVKDSFKETFLPTEDRASVVEITFIDKNKNWEKTTQPIYRDDWDDGGITLNPTGLQLLGITTWEQAFREGKYYLRRNRYINRAISFRAGIDATTCDIGDIILFQHDVPGWGQGGRVLAYLGSNRLKLNKPVTFVPSKTYNLIIKHAETDELVTYGVTATGAATTTDDVTLDQVLARAIVPGDDIFSMGEENIEAKPYSVTAITRKGELENEIECQEYQAAVYDETETVVEIDYSAIRTIAEVENLQAMMITSVNANGIARLELVGTWNLPVSQGEIISGFLYSYSTDDGATYGPATETQAMNFRVDVTQDVSYKIKVKTINHLGQISAGVVAGPISSTTQIFPPNPLGIAAAPQTVAGVDGWRLAVFTAALPANFAGFVFRYVAGSTDDWAAGMPLNPNPILINTYDTTLLPADTTVTVMVKTINTAGVLSLDDAHTTFTTPAAPTITVLSSFDCGPAWTTNGTIEGNATVVSGSIEADALGTTPETYEEFIYWFSKNMGFNGYISLDFNIEGDFQVRYSVVSGTWITYTGPFLVTASTTVDYEITIESTTTQGVINSMNLTQWSPARIDDTGWHVIPSTGETIAPTSVFNSIQAVETNIVNTATETATQVQVTAIDPVNGAHFQGYNPAGAAAALKVNIIYLGY